MKTNRARIVLVICIIVILCLSFWFYIPQKTLTLFTGRWPQNTTWMDSKLDIEITSFTNYGGQYRAIIYPYKWGRSMDIKIMSGGLIVDDRKLRFPKNKHIAIINSNCEVVFIDELPDDIVVRDSKQRIRGMDSEKLEHSEIWENTILPFMGKSEENLSPDTQLDLDR